MAEGSRPGGSQEPKTRFLLTSFVRDDKQGQNRGPSPSGMLRDRVAQDDKKTSPREDKGLSS